VPAHHALEVRAPKGAERVDADGRDNAAGAPGGIGLGRQRPRFGAPLRRGEVLQFLDQHVRARARPGEQRRAVGARQE
jgi:hypothetical protein